MCCYLSSQVVEVSWNFLGGSKRRPLSALLPLHAIDFGIVLIHAEYLPPFLIEKSGRRVNNQECRMVWAIALDLM